MFKSKINIKSIIFIILISITCNAYSADSIWEAWSSDNNGDWYLLKDSVSFEKETSTVWFMKNLKTQQVLGNGTNYKSLRVQYEYDCKELSEIRILTKGFSSSMGTGTEVFSEYNFNRVKKVVYSPSDWEQNYSQFCKKKWAFWK